MRKISIVKLYGQVCYDHDYERAISAKIDDWHEVTEEEFWALVKYIARAAKSGERMVLVQPVYNAEEEFTEIVKDALEAQKSFEAAQAKEAAQRELKRKNKKELQDKKKAKEEKLLFEELKRKFEG